ncbi:hypothetical protein PR202_gb14193 [Eleusine coracana subsp. coracana]|uniref:DUF6598 domain-containing protein n=1 Tax=Eleusine coracana subsp. coracana TaxID=191504 RepID=A0AAV5EV42_ELECO|nr:hypothetical protein PR202_gb14193 [Eleusine coracana subsp. coracana]
MIKGERAQDKPLSKRLLEIDGRVMRRQNIEVRSVSCDSRLSTVQVEYAVVEKAVEATVEFQVLRGDFRGQITAHTTSILQRIVLHDNSADGMATCDSGIIQLQRRVISVCLHETLILTIIIVRRDDNDVTAASTRVIEFAPSLNGADEDVVSCGTLTL